MKRILVSAVFILNFFSLLQAMENKEQLYQDTSKFVEILKTDDLKELFNAWSSVTRHVDEIGAKLGEKYAKSCENNVREVLLLTFEALLYSKKCQENLKQVAIDLTTIIYTIEFITELPSFAWPFLRHHLYINNNTNNVMIKIIDNSIKLESNEKVKEILKRKKVHMIELNRLAVEAYSEYQNEIKNSKNSN